MASYFFGKRYVTKYLKNQFPIHSTCLDVGANNAKWFKLLGNHFVMDGVEAWKPYIVKYKLNDKYRKLIHANIKDVEDFDYDVIIMGDILEHMSVEDGQEVVKRMYPKCKELVIAVPFKYKQGAIHGNPFEVHLQPDLTPEIFDERYPGFKALWKNRFYAYYIKDTNYKKNK